MRHRTVNQCLPVLGLANIRRHKNGITALRAQQRCRFFARLLVDVRHHDFGTLTRKNQRNGTPDSRRSTGYQCYLVLQHINSFCHSTAWRRNLATPGKSPGVDASSRQLAASQSIAALPAAAATPLTRVPQVMSRIVRPRGQFLSVARFVRS